jgi:zinc/manganese transport system substrate-binding protein
MAASFTAQAELNVFACEPEWADLTQKIGGDQVKVFSATHGLQDPHHVQARPKLLAKASRADLLVCTGAELEVGWLPVILQRTGNPNIQPGQPGYFMATDYVPLLEKPIAFDRSLGDVHAKGNPHIQTSPANIQKVAQHIAERLAELDPAHAETYRANWQAFDVKWTQKMQQWQQQTAFLKGQPIVTHHQGWIYLIKWLGLNEVATLEPKPGVAPTSSHLMEVLNIVKRTGAKVDIYAAYQDNKADLWLAKRAHIKAVKLPFTVGGTPQAKDIFSLFDDTFQRLVKAYRD